LHITQKKLLCRKSALTTVKEAEAKEAEKSGQTSPRNWARNRDGGNAYDVYAISSRILVARE
jgi:hypothetical protein